MTGTVLPPAPAVPEEPIPNPGLPAHEWRPTDVDERAADVQIERLRTRRLRFGRPVVPAVGVAACERGSCVGSTVSISASAKRKLPRLVKVRVDILIGQAIVAFLIALFNFIAVSFWS